MKEIKLTRGYITLIDDEDYERINRFKWHAAVTRNNLVYACRSVGNRKVWMHRQILRLYDTPGLEVDHVDHNSLNNQKCNLNLVTHAENLQNSRHGDCVSSTGWGWQARVRRDGKRIYLGHRKTKEEALKLVENFLTDRKKRADERRRIN